MKTKLLQLLLGVLAICAATLLIVCSCLIVQVADGKRDLEQAIEQGELLDRLRELTITVNSAKREQHLEWDRIEAGLEELREVTDKHEFYRRQRQLNADLTNINLRTKLALRKAELAFNTP